MLINIIYAHSVLSVTFRTTRRTSQTYESLWNGYYECIRLELYERIFMERYPGMSICFTKADLKATSLNLPLASANYTPFTHIIYLYT